jgi:S-adenosylmethionine decarboxylase proenzyme
MQVVGNQVLVEFVNCKLEYDSSTSKLEVIFAEALKNAGLTVLSLCSHQYEPIGVTVVAILSESHAVLHTYPEHRYLSLDIFTCGASIEKSSKAIEILKAQFLPERVIDQVIKRGD